MKEQEEDEQRDEREEKKNAVVEKRLVLLAAYLGGRLSLVRGSLIEGETSSTFFESASCGSLPPSPSTRSSLSNLGYGLQRSTGTGGGLSNLVFVE